MELGNMLSLMLLVTKIVLTTIRPGQNNPNLLLRHKDSNTNKTNPKHTSVHPLSGGVVNASSFPARGTATAWHSTQHRAQPAHNTEHTAQPAHSSQHTCTATTWPWSRPNTQTHASNLPCMPRFSIPIEFQTKNTNKQNTNPKRQPVASSLPPTPPYFASMHWIAQTALFFAFQLSFNRIIHK